MKRDPLVLSDITRQFLEHLDKERYLYFEFLPMDFASLDVSDLQSVYETVFTSRVRDRQDLEKFFDFSFPDIKEIEFTTKQREFLIDEILIPLMTFGNVDVQCHEVRKDYSDNPIYCLKITLNPKDVNI